MAVHITYFVHGATLDNETKRSSGWNDVALSQLGKEQAHALRKVVEKERYDAVFCSDLVRAKKTADIAFGGLAPIHEDHRLRECDYGVHNGGLSSEVEPLQEKAIHTAMPGSESYEEVKARIASFLKFLKEEYDGKRVAIVAHKAPQLALDVLIKHRTWPEAFREDWRKSNAWKPGWEYELP